METRTGIATICKSARITDQNANLINSVESISKIMDISAHLSKGADIDSIFKLLQLKLL